MLIVGVGGQGTLLASKILGNYAALIGKDCKLSEVHGMAQRGGSVVTFVRISDKVHSPIIDKKGADVILAFEELEAIRWADYLKDGGKIIINKQNISPLPVITGKMEYPSDIYERLSKINGEIYSINALEIAKNLNDLRMINVAVLGFCAKLLNLDIEKFKEAIKMSVAPKTLETNLKAFDEGLKNA
jgi:indolepyruvate ferredoxin oxidoreductase beta subunit